LQNYLQDKFLNEKIYQELKTLLDLWGKIGQIEQEIATQEQRRAKIYQAQEQAQKNMSVLSQDGEEGQLRGRYVKQLADSEEELTQIDQNVLRMQTEIKQLDAQIEQALAQFG
jgi:predicted  nucleic acid-binding Zn-ribbon protein